MVGHAHDFVRSGADHHHMTKQSRAAYGLSLAVCLSVGLASSPNGQVASARREATEKRTAMTTHARGTFEVKLNPLPADEASRDPALGRMSIDKQFHGDLDGTSKGQMLSAGTEVRESAGYVAIERVTGTLQGRRGTFVLQHSGLMARGVPQLTITVVPDSGTGQLVGLAGTMGITIANGKHSYDFEYTLPEGR
jgi:hypothetical protein